MKKKITKAKPKKIAKLTSPDKEKEKNKASLLPSIQKEEKSKKVKNGEKKKENYITWTNPEYVEANGRWEYYQKSQDGETLEIYHNTDEIKIRQEHKSKILSHIIAQIKPEEKKKEERTNESEHKRRADNIKNQMHPSKREGGKKQIDSSVYLHNAAILMIWEMKLRGEPTEKIFLDVSKEFGLKVLSVGMYYSKVLEDIRSRTKEQLKETIRVHLERYEALFNWFRSNGHNKLALKVMERKEKLVGMHGEEVDMNGLLGIVEGDIGTKDYDFEKLNDSERLRVGQLVKKSLIVGKKK